MKKGERKEKLEIREVFPLKWPDWPRTRIQDRETRSAWKKTDREAMESLRDELQRFDAFGIVLTRKDPSDRISAPDPSVAVYFSRRREEDYRWQEALGIDDPAPSLEEISRAHRELAKRYHPDHNVNDAELMVQLNRHKDNAIRYVKQLTGEQYQTVVACDRFEHFRWNVNAVAASIRSLRQLERDGASPLLERAMQGFAAQLTEGRPNVVSASA